MTGVSNLHHPKTWRGIPVYPKVHKPLRGWFRWVCHMKPCRARSLGSWKPCVWYGSFASSWPCELLRPGQWIQPMVMGIYLSVCSWRIETYRTSFVYSQSCVVGGTAFALPFWDWSCWHVLQSGHFNCLHLEVPVLGDGAANAHHLCVFGIVSWNCTATICFCAFQSLQSSQVEMGHSSTPPALCFWQTHRKWKCIKFSLDPHLAHYHIEVPSKDAKICFQEAT